MSFKHDHQKLDEYYNNILNAKDDEEKVRWQNQLTWELARHSVAEELVVYPALAKYITNGKEMADKDRRQHQTVSSSTASTALGRGLIGYTYRATVAQGASLRISGPPTPRSRLRVHSQDTHGELEAAQY